jgi:hypothetical protein
MVVAFLLLVLITAGNLALGFVVATVLGHGPLWAERMLPKRLRGDASLPDHPPASSAH